MAAVLLLMLTLLSATTTTHAFLIQPRVVQLSSSKAGYVEVSKIDRLSAMLMYIRGLLRVWAVSV